MNMNMVKFAFALLLGGLCAPGAFAQEQAAPAPKPSAPKAADPDAKAKLLERRRSVQAANAAKAKAKAQERQKAAQARAEAEAKAIDLNRASKAELKKLPGITDAYADAIIARRPYKTKAELVTWKVLPMEVYQAIHGQVAAKYVPAK
jgi:DNA uptake protein ComE-like DNA-binding protein